jgi:hypothetical protein
VKLVPIDWNMYLGINYSTTYLQENKCALFFAPLCYFTHFLLILSKQIIILILSRLLSSIVSWFVLVTSCYIGFATEISSAEHVATEKITHTIVLLLYCTSYELQLKLDDVRDNWVNSFEWELVTPYFTKLVWMLRT